MTSAEQGSSVQGKLLQGKRFLVAGIASKLSIAYGIAQALHREGAELAFTYPNEKLKKRVDEFAGQMGSTLVFACDVADDAQIEQTFIDLGQHWDGLDGVVHSIGFAPADQLDGDFTDITSREGFKIAHDISAYSFIAIARAAKPLLQARQGCLLTLTYQGSERVLPNYNVMGLAKASLEASVRYLASSLGKDGIRVNAISAGPIRTLAASGIKSFRKMLDVNASIAPLQRNVTIEEVGNAALFLCSPWASGITGEIMYVDGGFNTVGMSESLLNTD
ncbi:enoyl-ACP reductase FabI [Alkanindiges illinoisensis]|uniref:Enoyl-[acyl-carrier-protein] reductase [NADH] n=1 Tax=Alkanindiges illinoisensis TaxID=197183 RepID=A0A4Y7X9J1_9GAMM|nr:enoyl-ACP reductase [Alkanindiges illinoisensis]TEU23924.1 enoyl-ACP reductase [Alkanindiges illinoisensis]